MVFSHQIITNKSHKHTKNHKIPTTLISARENPTLAHIKFSKCQIDKISNGY